MMHIVNKLAVLLSGILIISGCTGGNTPVQHKPAATSPPPAVNVPAFNSDSAYAYVAAQVAFGPRVPGSGAHSECAAWLTGKLKSYGAEVIVQTFKARAYNGKILTGKNIIASFNPKAHKRIMLSSHWDSRPFADHDPDPANHYKPIDGANDGASGVGILLEMARNFQKQNPAVGVDIFLWDLEDYGEHSDEQDKDGTDSWALGSQYWSQNKHHPSYSANYGILLDMVGAENPSFTKEYFSMQYAPAIVDKVWATARKLGYGDVFLNVKAGAVTDDHVYVNRYAGIPTIDIIHYNSSAKSGFFPQWHTLGDNMEIISKSTLNIVGTTLMHVVYEEK
jgi:hypothetical protein